MSRFSKWGGIVVGVLFTASVVLLLALGAREDAGVARAEVRIGAPPAAIFDVVSDLSNMPRWIDGITEIEPEEQRSQRVTRAAVVMDDEYGHWELIAEIEAMEPPHSVRVNTRGADPDMGYSSVATFRLVPEAEGTRVVLTERTTYENALAKLFEPLVTPAATEKIARDLENLERLVETSTSS